MSIAHLYDTPDHPDLQLVGDSAIERTARIFAETVVAATQHHSPVLEAWDKEHRDGSSLFAKHPDTIASWRPLIQTAMQTALEKQEKAGLGMVDIEENPDAYKTLVSLVKADIQRALLNINNVSADTFSRSCEAGLSHIPQTAPVVKEFSKQPELGLYTGV